MAKYNVYRLNKEDEKDLLGKLEKVGLELVGEENVDSFTISFYLSVKPEEIDIWWTKLYADLMKDLDVPPKNKAHFAVCIISNDQFSYAISMGKSHFYLKDYCDSDFGINLAERIADPASLKMKNSKLFGGKRNKTIVSYQDNSELEYDSGESIQYVKARTIDPEKWGKTASFGNSAQLYLEITPLELPYLITSIEAELKKEARVLLPRAKTITDEARITKLDLELAKAISRAGEAQLQAADAVVSGVDFVFLDQSSYRFLWNRRSFDVEGDLTLAELKRFVDQENIQLDTELNRIRVKVEREVEKGFTKPLKYFLDYVDEDRNFLIDGKWHEFNQNYIDYLEKQIDNGIEVVQGPDLVDSDYQSWKTEQSPGTICYREAFYNQLQEKNGYFNLDREIEILQNKYKIEKADLYRDETLYFVKIGTPQKLSFVISQSIATVNVLRTLTVAMEIGGQKLKPRKICLWLVLQRARKIERLSELKSLIFLMRLAEWQRQCRNADLEAIVKLAYLQ